ncbi:MAG TPA: S8 family serine peptidase [Kofleriaceae bacterium]|nr:S8 family serine peptidase [Kofleriaceae bacterium]
MRNLFVGLVLGSSLLAACASDSPVDEEISNVSAAKSRYVVVFRSDTLPGDAASRITKAGGKAGKLLSSVGVATAIGDATFASKLAKDASVLSVGKEHSYFAPKTQMKKLDLAGQEGPLGLLYFLQWDIRRVGAPAVWARTAPGAARPRVAVLDTGVMDDHPDLAGQVGAMRSFSYCSTSGGPSNSPAYPKYSTYIDVVDVGGEWMWDGTCNPISEVIGVPAMYEPHGTHVSGTIAGTANVGVIGVAPNAEIEAYKVFDRVLLPTGEFVLNGFEGPIFDAIVDASNTGYPVISMSLGGTFDKRDGRASYLAWQRVLQYANKKGTLVVAAAGNSGLDLNGTIVNVPSDVPTVLNVSATGTNALDWNADGQLVSVGSDVLSFYSNFGAPVDVSAPGGDFGPAFNVNDPSTWGNQWVEHMILSSYIFEFDTETVDLDNRPVLAPAGSAGWAFFMGTSMATPHVAAVAAQVRALHPTWTPGAVRSWLKDHAEAIGPRQQFGHGLVNADLAVH